MTGGLDTEDLVTEVSNFALTSYLNNSHQFPSQLTTTMSTFASEAREDQVSGIGGALAFRNLSSLSTGRLL